MAFARSGMSWATAAMLGCVALAWSCARAQARADDGAAESSDPPKISAENATAFSLAKHHLAAVRADLAASADPSMHCKSLQALLPSLAGEVDPVVAKLAADGARTCQVDAPLAWGKRNAELLDAGQSNAAPCVHLEGALDELRRSGHAGDADVRALASAYDAHCRSFANGASGG